MHDYRIRAVTGGKDAQGEGNVELGLKYEESPDRAVILATLQATDRWARGHM